MTSELQTVGLLKEVLADLPDDMPIILSSDGEGNNYSYAWFVEPSKYVKDGEYRVDSVPHPDDLAEGEYDGCDLADALVLWPA